MDEKNDFVLKIKNCRAIRQAEIGLSDITVLTGVNASGKSTIARMFCNLVETSVAYDRLLAWWLWEVSLRDWYYHSELSYTDSHSISELLRKGEVSFENAVEKLRVSVQNLLKQETSFDRRSVLALCRKYGVEDGVEGLTQKFHMIVEKVLDGYKKQLTTRNAIVFKSVFPRDAVFDADSVAFMESNHCLCSFQQGQDKVCFDQIAGLKRAIYIESPFKSIPRKATPSVLDMPGDPFYRTKEASFLNFEGGTNLFQILTGGIEYDLESTDGEGRSMENGARGKWQYHRNDGQVFDLAECATGIKALSVLNILYSNGWLDSETLLIIDEPEAHLHPQWVVEYARILLLLNKKMKVRLLLTSHSPDMVNALSTIGKSLGLDSTMKFYLAEPSENSRFQFDFRDLGTRVGDIFKAYNVSFSKIDDYATKGLESHV